MFFLKKRGTYYCHKDITLLYPCSAMWFWSVSTCRKNKPGITWSWIMPFFSRNDRFPSHCSWFKFEIIIWFGFNPSEKYESQLGWLFHIWWKNKKCSKPPASYLWTSTTQSKNWPNHRWIDVAATCSGIWWNPVSNSRNPRWLTMKHLWTAPICSMSGIFSNTYPQKWPNVSHDDMFDPYPTSINCRYIMVHYPISIPTGDGKNM